MKIKYVVLIGAAFMPLLSVRASNPTVLSPVGPDPASHVALGQKGCLQVFTATETRADELTTEGYHGYFHPHSGYDVRDESGKIVKYVPNHASIQDESPDRVTLPAGHYNIVALSASRGLVSVPVLIESGKATVVRLD